jgi:hypothetical protein
MYLKYTRSSEKDALVALKFMTVVSQSTLQSLVYYQLVKVPGKFNPLTLELNLSEQACLPGFFTGDFKF